MSTAVHPTTAPPAGRSHSVFATQDPDQARAYVCRTYSETRLRPIGDQSRFRLREQQAHLGSLAVVDFSHTAGMEMLAEPLGRLMLARVSAGRWRCDTIGEQRRALPGDVHLLAQPDRPCLTGWTAEVHLQLVAIDPSMLLDVAAAPDGLVPRFTSLNPASAEGRRLVSRALDHLVHDVVGHPGARDSLLIRRAAGRRLAAALLAAFPNTAVREPGPTDRTDAARSHVLHAAIGYLHDHAHADITVRHLAAAAGVSRQAVHLAFQHHLHTTPQAYLRRVRLDRVHRDLGDLDPATTSVAQVALLWGFGRLDEFRLEYARTYGDRPEATLASGPAVMRSASRP